jgi:cysteine desulfurase
MNDRAPRVYLDNAATTPLDPRVRAAMLECIDDPLAFGNPSSVQHAWGRAARERIEGARAEVAAAVGVAPAQVIWTSGATEADNLALFGAARYLRSRGRHVLTARTEHAAVLAPCRQLEREGFAIDYLSPGPAGIVEPEQLAQALRADTVLVSLMHVNNETGVVQDVAAYAALCRARGIVLHVDAAQSAGKVPLDANGWGIDLLSLTAHKVHGPKGVGALCVRREPRLGLAPILLGGGQERGLRSGTLPTHQLVGMGAAYRLAYASLAEDARRIGALRDALWRELAAIPGVLLNGDPLRRAPGILSVSIEGVEGESLLHALDDIALASGSACASNSAEASYVLRALGRDEQLAQSSLRLSLGRFTTAEEVAHAARRIRAEVERLRALTPRELRQGAAG